MALKIDAKFKGSDLCFQKWREEFGKCAWAENK